MMRTREELEKFVKKPYHNVVVEEILDAQNKLVAADVLVEQLQSENEQLKTELNALKNSPHLALANAIGDYISKVTLHNSDIKKEVMSHLDIKVDTRQKYDPYSDSIEPCSNVNMTWKKHNSSDIDDEECEDYL